MGKKHLTSSIISSANVKSKETKYINKEVSLLENIVKNGNEANVFLSLRFLQYDYQCFSDWSKVEMSGFWKFNIDIHKQTWQQVYSSARKGKNKAGLAYTEIPTHKYPNPQFKKTLSKDITIFELRVNNKIRVHGFRAHSIFYLCWLDKNHEITN